MRQATYSARRYGEAAERVGHFARRGFTEWDRLGHALEIGRRDVAHVDVHPHVVGSDRLQLQLLIRLDHHVHRSAEELSGRLQLLPPGRRLDDIDDDDVVCAQLSGHIDRDIADQPAIGQHVLVGHDRCECARDRHACPHGGRQIAVLQDHHLTGDHVGRDSAVGDGQSVEVRLEPRARHEGAEQVLDAARIDQPARNNDPVGPQPEFEGVAVGRAVTLLLDRFEIPASFSADHLVPLDANQELLELCCRYPRRVAGAYQRAHAGARDAVDRHVELLQDLQHADMRATLCAATGQHEADPRPVTLSARRRVFGSSRLR